MLHDVAHPLDDLGRGHSRGRGVVLSEQADTAGFGFATGDVLAVGEGGVVGERSAEDGARVAVGEGIVRVGRESEVPVYGDRSAFGGAAAVDAEGLGLEGEG